ncbi:hypothetical protein ACFFX0_09925 [Citricoccus parietis]|uniref:Uncharacterized protein n=1 Tax=Citricoccus parietis TaxID=592307 RepID=A0ABV5FXW0_9MICC
MCGGGVAGGGPVWRGTHDLSFRVMTSGRRSAITRSCPRARAPVKVRGAGTTDPRDSSLMNPRFA